MSLGKDLEICSFTETRHLSLMVEQGWAIFDTEYLISNCEISMVPCIIIALSHNDQINCGALYSFQIISTQRYITNTVEYTTTLTHCEQGPCHANEQSWLFSSRPSVDHTYFASTEMSSFFNEIYITDRTGSCQIDNFQCSQWCGIYSPFAPQSSFTTARYTARVQRLFITMTS